MGLVGGVRLDCLEGLIRNNKFSKRNFDLEFYHLILIFIH